MVRMVRMVRSLADRTFQLCLGRRVARRRFRRAAVARQRNGLREPSEGRRWPAEYAQARRLGDGNRAMNRQLRVRCT